MSISENHIATNLYEKVYKQKVKQSDIAAAVGCSEGMITKIITRDKIPSLKVLIGISKFLGCTPNDLLEGEDDADESV